MPVVIEATAVVPYTGAQAPGVTILAIAGIISAVAILVFMVTMAIKACKSARLGCEILPETHVGPYIVSLLLANLVQSIGSILNVDWLIQGGTVYEPACVAQAITKNIGNVGTALWSLIIAFHAFDVLFLRHKQRQVTFLFTIIGTWIFVFCIDILGPVVLETPARGPFFGISGYWCWITANYPTARVFLEYIFMFVSAFLCAIIYSIVFLRLRGNLSGEGWRNIRFRRIPRSERWALKIARDEVDGRMYKVASQLMWYPLIYSLVIVPIAVARFVDFAGHDVPFWLTITADFFFNLNGFFNVILCVATYRRLPLENLPSFSTPRKSLCMTNGITPFVLPPAEDQWSKTQTDLRGHDLEKAETSDTDHRASISTHNSFASASSNTPLTNQRKD